MKAYLHFGGPFTNEPDGPFLTVETKYKEDLLQWQKQNLSYTASGYGNRIPTRYKVLYNGRWRRVYAAIHSNNGISYIGDYHNTTALVSIC